VVRTSKKDEGFGRVLLGLDDGPDRGRRTKRRRHECSNAIEAWQSFMAKVSESVCLWG
jgi:hypothetical protein